MAFGSEDDDENDAEPVDERAAANDAAAFAYDKQVRPSWSVCFMLALCCNAKKKNMLVNILGWMLFCMRDCCS